jgi:octaprenyl-diphosphate synthase
MDSIGVLQEVSKRDGVGGRIVEVLRDAANLVGEDLSQLESDLTDACNAAPGNLKRVCGHIVGAGGKHVRPILCLLAFRSVGGKNALPMDLAATCELLHNATLLHDDVIDEGDTRRGRPTARVVYGNALSVLGGDYLLIKTIELVAERAQRFMPPFLSTLNQLVQGELAQLERRGSIETTEEEYFQIIEGKTASLFRWSVTSGAMAAGVDNTVCEQIGCFGWHVGVAFQLMDDVLDFAADQSTLGKNLLSDIGEGKMTLPVILASRGSADLRPLLSQLVKGTDPARLVPAISSIINDSGVIEEVKERAVAQTAKGLKALRAVKGIVPEILLVIEELASALLSRRF